MSTGAEGVGLGLPEESAGVRSLGYSTVIVAVMLGWIAQW